MSEMATIEDDQIVIRIPISALPQAAQLVWDEEYGMEEHSLSIGNLDEFAKDFVRELNDEDGEGSTPVHLMLDGAILSATNNGSLGVTDGDEQGTDDE